MTPTTKTETMYRVAFTGDGPQYSAYSAQYLDVAQREVIDIAAKYPELPALLIYKVTTTTTETLEEVE